MDEGESPKPKMVLSQSGEAEVIGKNKFIQRVGNQYHAYRNLAELGAIELKRKIERVRTGQTQADQLRVSNEKNSHRVDSAQEVTLDRNGNMVFSPLNPKK